MTKKQFKILWKLLLDAYNATIVKKSNSQTMKVIAELLDLLGIQDDETFFEDWAITIKDNIYLPFTVGNEEELGLFEQLSILAHELIHVKQWEDPLFAGRYISSTAHRAEYEMKAIAAQMEVFHILTGRLLDTKLLANNLEAYKCKKADIRVVKKQLDIIARTIEKGGYSSKPALIILNSKII